MKTSTNGGRRATGRRLAAFALPVALALLAAFALVLAPAGRAQQSRETLRLRVEVTTPGASEPAVWHFFQGPEGVSMVPPRQPPHPLNAWALVEPGLEARPLIVQAERERLAPVWSPEEDYRPGMTVEGRTSELELRDLKWELIRGSADRTVAGRPTEHYVITATMKMVARPIEALERLGEDSTLVTSRTDLWIDRSLPFSWAPIAAWGSRALTVGHPVADQGLRERAGPRLAELGLPLRMATRITFREYGDADFTFGQDARSELVVTGIQPADPPAVPSRFLRYSRSSASQ